MWTYISREGYKTAIPYANIDYVVLSKGKKLNNSVDQFYHPLVDKYYEEELLTIVYRKSGGYLYFLGEVAFNQLSIISEQKFVGNIK